MKDFFKGVFILAVAAALVYFGYRFILTADEVMKDIDVTPNEITEGSYYYQLNDEEKVMYDGFLSVLQNGGMRYECPYEMKKSTMKKTLGRVAFAVLHDHPEIFWVKNGYSYSYKDSLLSDTVYDVCLEALCYPFWEYSTNPQHYYDELMRKVNEVAALASNLPNDYEKAKFFYEYIINNTYYDDERLEDARKTTHSPSSDLIYTPYACLVEGRAVCAGYASAYKLLLNKCGINCYYVTGWSGGTGHGWNCLELGGDYYYTDVTWGDGEFRRSDGTTIEGTVNFEYFCMTSSDMEKDHALDEDYLEHPYCTALKYEYFTYNGYITDTCTVDTVADIVKRQAGTNPALVRFSNQAAYTASEVLFSGYTLKEQLNSEIGFDASLIYYKDKRMIYVLRK